MKGPLGCVEFGVHLPDTLGVVCLGRSDHDRDAAPH